MGRFITYPFPEPHQWKTLAVGTTGEVYRFIIPTGHTAFIQRVASNDFDNSYAYWYIDGEMMEGKKIQRQIAPPNQPQPYDPPIMAQKSIVVKAYNGDVDSQTFEWIIDGIVKYYDTKDG